MFKRVVTHQGFWKSVLFMSVGYGVFLFLLNWLISGFSNEFYQVAVLGGKAWVFFLAGLIAGFAVTYAKFWKFLKERDYADKQ